MVTAREVEVPPLSLERMRGLIDAGEWARLEAGLDIAQSLLAERKLWNVNSTAAGEFFALTKRLHNLLHGDGGDLGETEREIYESVTSANAEAVLDAIGPRDIVFLHDPQTAGLIPRLAGTGRAVIWRCHIGADNVNLSPKNQEMTPAQVEAILRHAGLLAEDRRDGAEAVFTRPVGGTARVERRCEVVTDGFLPGPGTPLVAQVSRWDRLKDPIGVMRGFADALPGDVAAHLILAGPSLGSVADDPDGVAVLGETEEAWRALDPKVRSRVHLASLPMEDLEDGVTGLLPDPFDLEAFGAATRGLLEDPERARRMGLAAHQSVRASFLENRHTLQYVDLLGRLLVK